MHSRHVRFAATTIAALSLLACATLLAAPITTFEGTDATAVPGGPRPNSNAAAANFDAAAAVLGAVKLINFESAPLGSFTSLDIAPGVTATLQGTDTGGGIIADGGNSTTGFNTTAGGTRYLKFSPIFDIGTARLNFNFTPAVNAFGTFITGLGTASGSLFVLFNDGSSQSYPVTGSSTGGAKFFGFTDPGAAIVQVGLELRNVTGTRDIFGVDDLRYVTVPEPAAAILAAFAVFGLCRLPRRV
jgi:hypothetical protein